MERPLMTYVLAAAAIVAVLILAGCASGGSTTRSIAERFPPTGDFIEVNGTQLHYELTGPEAAPTVLVLHGASGNLHEPKLALDEVLADYRVLWIDRPGLGWSERPRDGTWHPGREAALITDMMTALGIEQAHIIGHSWGGAIAARLMMDYPERIKGGVLVAPALRAHVGDAAFYNHVTGWPVVGTLMTRVVVPNVGPGSLESGSISAFSPVEPPEGYVEDLRLPLILRPGPWRNNAHDMARVNISLEEQEGRYSEIAQPIIVIASEGDTVLLTDRHSVPFVETAQNAELRLIDGEGHNPHHAHAEDVAQALADVIARAG
jgi:pimeloyl-ACP methyl ester carboxylesterase